MGGSTAPIAYNQQVPNSKREGFTGIYRKKSLKNLQETPEPSIRSIRDVLKIVKERYGAKEGIGEIIVTKETNENGEQVEKRTVRSHTYNEVYETSYNLGRFIHSRQLFYVEELQKMKFIGIYSKNRYEWFVTDWACILFGVTTVPLYETLGVQNLTYCLNQTLMTSIFVSNITVKTLLKLKDIGRLRLVISYDPLDEESKALLRQRNLDYLDFWDIIKKGSELKDVNDSSIKTNINDCYTFSYTSGTTGPPKGAMVSHKNLLGCAAAFARHEDLKFNSEDRYLSYLPLPHLMERCVALMMFYVGAYLVISCGNPLKLKEDCQAIKVTFFISVPRIYNRIVQNVKAKFLAETGVKKCLIDCGVSSKLSNVNQSGEYSHAFYDSVIFSKVRQSFGGSIRLMASGSAPISAEVHSYMKAIMCCPLIEGYGQTESGAASIFTRALDTNPGVLTQITTGIEWRLADIPQMKYTSKDVDEQGHPRPRGQIWLRGPQVFLGYYKQPDVTREAVTEDGWLKTGDVGELYPQTNGFRIIDRKKNIFKLQQGEYLAPDRIEGFYAKCPLISEIFLHGDSLHAFAVAIVTPNKDQLMQLAQVKGIKGTFEQLCTQKAIKTLILSEMNAVGRRDGLHGFELAKNIFLETKGFLARGILTNTMKLIRFEARQVYKEQIKALYQEGELPTK